MTKDTEFIRFKGKLIVAAMKHNGSIEREAADFVQQIYSEWRASGNELGECERWLENRLKNVFLSLGDQPKWVEEEPNWPFYLGKPMIFISQVTMDMSNLSKEHLSPGETVYLFAAREPYMKGFNMVYRTVSQFE